MLGVAFLGFGQHAGGSVTLQRAPTRVLKTILSRCFLGGARFLMFFFNQLHSGCWGCRIVQGSGGGQGSVCMKKEYLAQFPFPLPNVNEY